MKTKKPRSFFRDNGLSLAMFSLFLLCWIGQALAGWRHEQHEQAQHSTSTLSLTSYLRSGEFAEATFENWESEFLQMSAFLLLSAVLIQRGSAESKDPDKEPDEAKSKPLPDSPSPVRRGGLALKLYNYSLTIALFSLFLISFIGHAIGGARAYSHSEIAHGHTAVSTLTFMTTPDFWFECLQNWQSEFLSVGVLVVLSIYLRQKGSPESKPVEAPHSQTGQ